MASIAQTWTRVRTRIELTRTALKRAPAIPVGMLAVVVFVAVFANVLAPHSPHEITLPNKLAPPFWVEGGSTTHLLGTDPLGRDILSRVIFGARVSMIVVFTALILAGFIGTVLGLISGYYGGRLDSVIMRMCDAMLSFPTILIALIFAVVLGPSFTNLIIVVVLIIWARYARVVRAETLTWKQRDFVAYARVAGTSPFKIMLRHLLPNVVNTIMVLLTFNAGYVIILEASLSFLGAGVPPPTPSWGGMASEGRQYIATAWWVSVFPGLAIVLVVLSINLFGDWLRDHLDPKLRQV